MDSCEKVQTRGDCPSVMCGAVLQTLQNYWLSLWSTAVVTWQRSAAAPGEEPSTPFPVMFYMDWYFGIGLIAIVVNFVSNFILVVATLNASQVRQYLRVAEPCFVMLPAPSLPFSFVVPIACI